MGSKTILVVEDDAIIRDLLREIFCSRFQIREAATFKAAYQEMGNNSDLALIDHVLPDGSGLDLAKEFLKSRPSLPVIIITGYGHEDLILDALRAGVRDYFRKPLIVPDLEKRILDILGEDAGDRGRDDSDACDRRDFIMDGICHYIEKHYMENLTLEGLSSMAGMDRFSFCKSFKERTSEGFVSFVNRVRIERASDLLRNQDLSVTEIADFVGFGSVEHFCRTFRLAHGISPGQYRKKMTGDAAY